MKKDLIKDLSRIKNNYVRHLVENTLAPEVIDHINDYAGGMMRKIQVDMNDKEALFAMETLEEAHVKELIYFLRMWIKGRQAVKIK